MKEGGHSGNRLGERGGERGGHKPKAGVGGVGGSQQASGESHGPAGGDEDPTGMWACEALALQAELTSTDLGCALREVRSESFFSRFFSSRGNFS